MRLTNLHAWLTLAIAAAAATCALRLRQSPLPRFAGCEQLPALIVMLAVLAAGLAVQTIALRRRLLGGSTARSTRPRRRLVYLPGLTPAAEVARRYGGCLDLPARREPAGFARSADSPGGKTEAASVLPRSGRR